MKSDTELIIRVRQHIINNPSDHAIDIVEAFPNYRQKVLNILHELYD